jgi:hypothetical protein
MPNHKDLRNREWAVFELFSQIDLSSYQLLAERVRTNPVDKAGLPNRVPTVLPACPVREVANHLVI